MEEILQDIHEFPFYTLAHAITWSTIYLIGTYFIRIREPQKNWWKHWKALAVVFLIIWLIWSSSGMGRPFVKHENFDSLTKIEGILKYDDDKEIYLTTFNSFNKEKYFKIKVHLLDYGLNVMKYENKSVTIWQKNNIAYQLECNGDVIYSLERSNEKVWLGIIWDLIRYYFFSFCGLLFFYVAILRFIKNKEEGIYDE